MRPTLPWTWFPPVFLVSLVLAVVATLLVQSRSKWALLRRVRGWPGVQRALDALGRPLAWWEFRQLPTAPARRRRRQPPPSPPP
jgi:hypothetical protein